MKLNSETPMKEGDIIARSVITTAVRRRTLLQGSFLAGLGMAILIIAGGFLPLEFLKSWGLPLFLAGGALITGGMIPYRKLARLEMNPYEICWGDSGTFLLIKEGKKILSIPIAAIKEVCFIEEGSLYGLGFILNQAAERKIVIHHSKYHPKSIPGRADLFLPYFSKRGVTEVQDCLDHSTQNFS